jgi:PAS domain S-box-containing protein
VKLQVKILMVVFIPTLILGLSLFAYFQANMVSSAQQGDRQIAVNTLKQTQFVINNELSHLGNVADDWASWTDTYNFVKNNNSDYISSNLGDETFQKLSLGLMVFIDNSGKIVYGKAYDLQNQAEILLSSELARYISDDSVLVSQTEITNGRTGIIILEQKPVLIAAYPILTSERQGPSHGTLIVGRFMDYNFLASVEVMTNTQLSVTLFEASSTAPNMSFSSPTDMNNQTVYVAALNSTIISAKILLSDVNGNPIVVLETLTEQTMVNQTKNDLFVAFLAVNVVTVASAVITFVLLSKFVISKITILSKKMGKIKNYGSFEERADIKGNDEISDLSGEFNAMLDEISQKDKENKRKAEKITNIVNGIGDLLFVIDKNRIITEVNKSVCEFFKKKPEELIGKHCFEVFHGNSCPWPTCPAAKTFETKQTVTEEINDPNVGIPFLVTTSPILDAQGEIGQVIHIAKDISKMKEAEMELHIAANLFDAASDSIFVHDMDGGLVFFNETSYKTRGYSREEFQKLKIKDLEAPDNPRVFEARMSQLLNSGESTFEAVNLRKDKTFLPVEINARVIESDGRKLVLNVARDITERKKAEINLKESHDKLKIMNEKLGVVGSLTRHDVRNKLSTVTGYAYLLKKKHSDQADIVEGLNKMENAVAESMKIFDFAKMYEQLGLEDLTYINVEAKLEDARNLFSGYLPRIICQCAGLSVLADSFLRQLFYNFIDNTRKHGQKTTTINVHCEKTDQDSLKLIYEDDGVGVSLENKVYLFKEGFSTGGSTGFGLFLTKKMMDVYGWQVEENGEQGRGVKFVITIPKFNSKGKENYRFI